MKRRSFLQRAVPASVLPFLLGGFTLRAYGRSPFLEALAQAGESSDRILVLVQLSGGNDGLNTVIPRDQYGALTIARSNILLPETSVLPLTTETGLHPRMTALQSLYLDGKVCVVQGVSYPNPNFSHFRATDIWLTGADYNQDLASGIWGRYLDTQYPNFPEGYPNVNMPDPLAITIGSVVSPGLQGPGALLGMAISNPSTEYLLPGGSDIAPNTPAGHELTFIRQVAEQTQVYSAAVRGANSRATNQATYPTSNTLADQLKIVARLIAGGLKTRVYVVTLGGFDTHSTQVDATDHTVGTHATLMGRISDAVGAFQQDLTLLGIDGRVLGMTFSEFGRRIKSNASGGTDHGTSVPMIFFGTNVLAGMVGTNPILGKVANPVSLTDIKDNLDMQFDFRRVYASVLRNWFGADVSALQSSVATPLYDDETESLPIISPGAIAEAEPSGIPSGFTLHQNYPNPFNPMTTIRFELPAAASVSLEVYDAAGQRIRTLAAGERPAGIHHVQFDASDLASGTYFYRLIAGNFIATRKAIVLR